MDHNTSKEDFDGLSHDLANTSLSETTPDHPSPSIDVTNGPTNGGSPGILPDRPIQAEMTGVSTDGVDAPKIPFASIPANVVCDVALKVGTSPMEGAGRGILVQEDLSAHSLIFTIKTPLVNIVSFLFPFWGIWIRFVY